MNCLNISWLADAYMNTSTKSTAWLYVSRFISSDEKGLMCICHDADHQLPVLLTQSAINNFEEKREISVRNILGGSILCKEYTFTSRMRNIFELTLEVMCFDSPASGSGSVEDIDHIPSFICNERIFKEFKRRMIKCSYNMFMLSEACTLNHMSPSNAEAEELSSISGGWLCSNTSYGQLDDIWGATPSQHLCIEEFATARIPDNEEENVFRNTKSNDRVIDVNDNISLPNDNISLPNDSISLPNDNISLPNNSAVTKGVSTNDSSVGARDETQSDETISDEHESDEELDETDDDRCEHQTHGKCFFCFVRTRQINVDALVKQTREQNFQRCDVHTK